MSEVCDACVCVCVLPQHPDAEIEQQLVLDGLKLDEENAERKKEYTGQRYLNAAASSRRDLSWVDDDTRAAVSSAELEQLAQGGANDTFILDRQNVEGMLDGVGNVSNL
jgi:hypothetical protein